VIYGDWNEDKASELEQQLRSEPGSNGGSVTSMKVDVRSYQSQLALFDVALHKHGRIDSAIFCAGIVEPSGWFEAENLNLETVRTVSPSKCYGPNALPGGKIILIHSQGTRTVR
jgi:NAD(P)-dependent dehydrogenase (short-subunit alcohol dehydrogenase family)